MRTITFAFLPLTLGIASSAARSAFKTTVERIVLTGMLCLPGLINALILCRRRWASLIWIKRGPSRRPDMPRPQRCARSINLRAPILRSKWNRDSEPVLNGLIQIKKTAI